MEQEFGETDREAIYCAIHERRDMRHFIGDAIATEVMRRLIDAGLHAPSVGFMQPWRILRITWGQIRAQLHDAVERERVLTADALGERRDSFKRLKVEGLRECAEVLVMALMGGRGRSVLGRRTLPEIDVASVVCAIQNMWPAERAEGFGTGQFFLLVEARRRALRDRRDHPNLGNQPRNEGSELLQSFSVSRAILLPWSFRAFPAFDDQLRGAHHSACESIV
jgi:5,6-dimethylbenzimidazole synthase